MKFNAFLAIVAIALTLALASFFNAYVRVM